MVVNEAFRKRFFPNGGDPVGSHIDDSDTPDGKSKIVGVATSLRQDLNQPPMPEMDWLMDAIAPKDRLQSMRNTFLLVRSGGDLRALESALRGIVHDIDPTMPFRGTMPMTQVVSEGLVFERMVSWLFGTFASFALLLAVIGIYGLVNHEVELRTREIGIRMALGSTRELVMRQVLRRVVSLMAIGLGCGWVLTLMLKRALSAVVTMNAAHDLALLAGVTVGLAMAGILASLLTAKTAASTEPMDALRTE
jgi:ABC-type antimicrobial peptide transport system permease subunit